MDLEGLRVRHQLSRETLSVLLVFSISLLAAGCSIKKFAAGSIGNSLAEGGTVFAADDDPELIRDAVPFGLKTIESLLEIVPRHRNLLLAACQGYTQYSYAFVQADADMVETTDYTRATELRERALKLFLRAQRFGLRGLETKHRGISEELKLRPEAAAAKIGAKELPMLYWTAAAWGSAISLGKDRPELVADLSAVRALMQRGVALGEDFDGGSIHEALIVLEALPEMMGGSVERARGHFRRAVELSKGTKAGPYVTLAGSVSVMTQNRAEFRELLNQALQVDPDREPSARLANIILQRKARRMLDQEDALFLDADTLGSGE